MLDEIKIAEQIAGARRTGRKIYISFYLIYVVIMNANEKIMTRASPPPC
jgi:hypothetical protein